MQEDNTPKPGDEIKPWQPPTAAAENHSSPEQNTAQAPTENPSPMPAPAQEPPKPVAQDSAIPSPPASETQATQPAPQSTMPSAQSQDSAPLATLSEPIAAEESSWAYTGDEEQFESPQTIETVEWTASEYIAHEKSPTWFAGVAAASALCAAVIFFITRELLASVTILVVAFAGMFFSARRPDTRRYRLSSNGLEIDDKSYTMSDFRSFSVVREGALESIWLETLQKFSPTIRLYFAPEDGERIVDSLSQVLPYSQKELDVVEKASRKIRF